MIDRRPDSCAGAGFIAAVYTASILSTAATKRAAPSSVSVVAAPILQSLRDGSRPAALRTGAPHIRYYPSKLLTIKRTNAEIGVTATREEPHVHHRTGYRRPAHRG